MDSWILGDTVFANDILRNRTSRKKARVLVPLPELMNKVSSIVNVGPASIRRSSKTRSFAEARGIVCYVAIRELGCNGFE
jgi:chromosomal replication initiation ATPase DnaA